HRFTACVAGLDENRASISGRMERPDGRVIDYATVPLPDGQTMVTFVDVTDSVQGERALVERNEAIEAAFALVMGAIERRDLAGAERAINALAGSLSESNEGNTVP